MSTSKASAYPPSSLTDEEILKLIGKNVKKARARAGLTQECVGELLGVTWQTISFIESGRYAISVTRLARLIQVLEAAPGEFYEGLPAPEDITHINAVKKALARKRRPKGSLS